MTVQEDRSSANRRKRVQTLKKLIILFLITAILTPIVFCIVLLVRVNALEEQIGQLQLALAEAGQQAENAGVQMSENSSQGFIMEPELLDSTEERNGNPGQEGAGSPGETQAEAQTGKEETVRKIYLTFDDGPSTYTDDILDILAEYDVKATFFVVGKEGEWAEEAYRRIVEEGHTLGMHTYTHEYSTIYASVDGFAADLSRLQEYLYEVTGVWSRYVRFPGGSSNTVSKVDMKEFIAYLNDEGLVYFDWNVSSQDASRTTLSAEEIVDNCMEGITRHDTVVILMHDAAGRRSTVEALPILIEKLQAMENTELLPITEDTEPVQHITITQEETED